MEITYYAKSIKGKKSKENEDSYIIPVRNEIMEKEPDLERQGYLFAVCDGMGGHQAGQVASSLCSKWLLHEYYQQDEIKDPVTWMIEELESLNSRLYQLSLENEQYHGMGTTAVTLMISDDKAYIHNVGDSRCYKYHHGDLKQLTKDDSVVWDLYEKGMIAKDDIIKNNRKHVITQAIASEASVDVRTYPVLNLRNDLIFLLCSDGLHDVMIDDQIKNILNDYSDLEKNAEKLINLALQNKSKDDITLILVSINTEK
ncbi:MAG: serine/threonine-protein phosphatase [Candidatus Delongbacteria bacterium]|nr:serine/threonine-protein phosphatase [Candidatus Delongbacteria bacterium]